MRKRPIPYSPATLNAEQANHTGLLCIGSLLAADGQSYSKRNLSRYVLPDEWLARLAEIRRWFI